MNIRWLTKTKAHTWINFQKQQFIYKQEQNRLKILANVIHSRKGYSYLQPHGRGLAASEQVLANKDGIPNLHRLQRINKANKL